MARPFPGPSGCVGRGDDVHVDFLGGRHEGAQIEKLHHENLGEASSPKMERLALDDPGSTFFHCPHQDHMDEGVAGLIIYR
jgi:hypothetical protein